MDILRKNALHFSYLAAKFQFNYENAEKYHHYEISRYRRRVPFRDY